jgi:hypothetical protein
MFHAVGQEGEAELSQPSSKTSTHYLFNEVALPNAVEATLVHAPTVIGGIIGGGGGGPC